MVNVEAKLKIKGKNFEVFVDVDKALQFKKGLGKIDNVLATDIVFYDIKKGLKASASDLKEIFGTEDAKIAAEKIIRQGELNVPTSYKKEEKENKLKQVIDFLAKNAVDPGTDKPHSETRIRDAIKQAGINVDNKPIEQQISGIITQLRVILPIKIETKKLRIIVPALHTGKVYGLVNEYKEKEEWLANGDLSCIVNIPAGFQLEFYDKLNGITHGSAVVEEIK